jgi:hypothetical protein
MANKLGLKIFVGHEDRRAGQNYFIFRPVEGTLYQYVTTVHFDSKTDSYRKPSYLKIYQEISTIPSGRLSQSRSYVDGDPTLIITAMKAVDYVYFSPRQELILPSKESLSLEPRTTITFKLRDGKPVAVVQAIDKTGKANGAPDVYSMTKTGLELIKK